MIEILIKHLTIYVKDMELNKKEKVPVMWNILMKDDGTKCTEDSSSLGRNTMHFCERE